MQIAIYSHSSSKGFEYWTRVFFWTLIDCTASSMIFSLSITNCFLPLIMKVYSSKFGVWNGSLHFGGAIMQAIEIYGFPSEAIPKCSWIILPSSVGTANGSFCMIYFFILDTIVAIRTTLDILFKKKRRHKNKITF